KLVPVTVSVVSAVSEAVIVIGAIEVIVGAVVTVTVAVAAADPEHVIEYVVVAAGLTVAVPLVPSVLPVQLPVHAVAFVELQLSVEVWPPEIDVGLALSVAV